MHESSRWQLEIVFERVGGARTGSWRITCPAGCDVRMREQLVGHVDARDVVADCYAALAELVGDHEPALARPDDLESIDYGT